MKTVHILFIVFGITILSSNIKAQTTEESVQATITLANGAVQNGLAKDNLAKKGNIVFIENATTKKQTFDGTDLQKLTINGTEYLCIKGDFFKTICSGKICLLQKTSKTSSRVLYSGSDPIGIAGSDGKLGDYYLYKSNILTLLNQKNVAVELASHTNDCNALITSYDKENLATIAAIITSYNNCK